MPEIQVHPQALGLLLAPIHHSFNSSRWVSEFPTPLNPTNLLAAARGELDPESLVPKQVHFWLTSDCATKRFGPEKLFATLARVLVWYSWFTPTIAAVSYRKRHLKVDIFGCEVEVCPEFVRVGDEIVAGTKASYRYRADWLSAFKTGRSYPGWGSFYEEAQRAGLERTDCVDAAKWLVANGYPLERLHELMTQYRR